MDYFNEKIKNLKWYDISLIKLSVAFAILFLLKVWPAFMGWVHSTNMLWFLVLFVVVSIKPFYTFYVKK